MLYIGLIVGCLACLMLPLSELYVSRQIRRAPSGRFASKKARVVVKVLAILVSFALCAAAWYIIDAAV